MSAASTTHEPLHIALVGAECEENLALRYIRAALEAAGHTVVQVVFNGESELEEAARELAALGTDLAGFSMVFTYRADEFARLAGRARELGYAGHLVAGGHFAAFNADALLRDEPAFDSVIIGEGEQPMGELAGNLDSLPAVRGLVWRNAGGDIVRNQSAAKPADLDALPFPTRKQPADAYLGLPIANILSSRGCTHACSFCSISAWHRMCGGERFRLRKPALVAEEVAQLYRQGYRIFNFHDDNFFLDDLDACLGRTETLDRELRRRDVGRIAFAVKSRPDTVDEALFARLQEMGLFRVFLGIEAGTAEALRRLGRGQSQDDNERALDIVNRLDLHACFNLLLLNPDSTLEDLAANVDFLRRRSGNPMNFCRTEVYSGTPLEARLRRAGRLQGGYWGYGYRIADERAQLAFELMHEGLFARHHGYDNPQHLAMRVDYERQLLSHFFHCPPKLRRRAKEFIVRVNHRSCEYLEEIVEAAATGFPTPAARAALLGDLVARVAADGHRDAEAGARLLDAIQHAARPPRTRARGWSRQAASVAVATSLAMGMASCDMAPLSSDAMADTAPPDKAPAKAPPDGEAAALKAQFGRSSLMQLAGRIQPARDIEVEMWVDKEGKVSLAKIYKSGGSNPVKELTTKEREEAAKLIQQLGVARFKDREQAQQALLKLGSGAVPQLKQAMARSDDPEVVGRCARLVEQLDGELHGPAIEAARAFLRGLSFAASQLRGKRYVIAFSKQELARGGRRIHPPHVFEMAPAPRD